MGFFNFFKKKIPVLNIHPYTTAIIAAAGGSSRMGETCENKQFMLINGRPVISYTLAAFEEADTIDEIIIAVREDDILHMADLAKDFGFDKVTKIIKGGETRQESIFNVIAELNPKTEFIAVHDGARPFVTAEIIDNVSGAAFKHNAAAACVPVKDTIKLIDRDGFIVNTVERASLKAVQTPQTFLLDLYKAGAALAQKRGTHYTDDCQLIEQAGAKVFLVEGSFNNIKITTPEDIAAAEFILSSLEDNMNSVDS